MTQHDDQGRVDVAHCAYWFHGERDAKVSMRDALAAADAHDTAQGIRRVRVNAEPMAYANQSSLQMLQAGRMDSVTLFSSADGLKQPVPLYTRPPLPPEATEAMVEAGCEASVPNWPALPEHEANGLMGTPVNSRAYHRRRMPTALTAAMGVGR